MRPENCSESVVWWNSLVILELTVSVVQWFLNLIMLQNHWEGLLSHGLLASNFSVFSVQKILVGTSWICISNKFPSNAVAAGLGTTFGKLVIQHWGKKLICNCGVNGLGESRGYVELLWQKLDIYCNRISFVIHL